MAMATYGGLNVVHSSQVRQQYSTATGGVLLHICFLLLLTLMSVHHGTFDCYLMGRCSPFPRGRSKGTNNACSKLWNRFTFQDTF